jgi:hypothetical protein
MLRSKLDKTTQKADSTATEQGVKDVINNKTNSRTATRNFGI